MHINRIASVFSHLLVKAVFPMVRSQLKVFLVFKKTIEYMLL